MVHTSLLKGGNESHCRRNRQRDPGRHNGPRTSLRSVNLILRGRNARLASRVLVVALLGAAAGGGARELAHHLAPGRGRHAAGDGAVALLRSRLRVALRPRIRTVSDRSLGGGGGGRGGGGLLLAGPSSGLVLLAPERLWLLGAELRDGEALRAGHAVGGHRLAADGRVAPCVGVVGFGRRRAALSVGVVGFGGRVGVGCGAGGAGGEKGKEGKEGKERGTR